MPSNQDTAPKVWRGNTLDDRAAIRRAALVRAGYELFGDVGTPAVTMRAVSRHAGLSLRYFYESFSDTSELLLEIYDSCNSELAAAIVGTGPAADLRSTVFAAVDAAARYFEADPRRVRILLREPLSNELLGARRAAITPDLLRTAAAGIDASLDDSADFAMTASALSGALVALVLDWTDGRLRVTRTQLTEHATRLVLDALRVG